MRLHPNDTLKVPNREPDHVEVDETGGKVRYSFYWFYEMICLLPRKADHITCKMMFCEFSNELMYMPYSLPVQWISITHPKTLEAWQRYLVDKELLGAFPEQESSKT